MLLLLSSCDSFNVSHTHTQPQRQLAAVPLLVWLSLRRLLLDLSKPVHPPHHCFESALVAASRIGEGKYLRVLPGCDLGHLASLQGDPKVHAWMQGFPPTGGVWNRAHAQAALDALQLQQPGRRAGRGGAVASVSRAGADRGAGGGRGGRGRGGGAAATGIGSRASSGGRGRGSVAAAEPASVASMTPSQLRALQAAQPATPPPRGGRDRGGAARGGRRGM